MTTTPEEIANLVSATNALLDEIIGKEGVRDAQVLAYGAQINGVIANFLSASRRTIFVHATLGDDLNPGTEAEPMRTIDEALKSIPAGGQLTVNLLSDYTVDRVITLQGGSLFVAGYNEQHRLTFADVNPLDRTLERSPGFMPVQGGNLQYVRLQNLYVSGANVPTPPECLSPGFFQVNGLMAVRFHACELELPAGSDQNVFASPNGGVVTLVVTNSIVPPEMAGRWVDNVAAGTDPLTLRTVVSNLSAL
ncbi:MAG: hypothetical protein AAGI09_02935 [Pseudomonadota bacterium]